MLSASIKQDGIVIKKIELPENAKELTYGMYLDYDFMQTELSSWIANQMKRGRNFEYQYTTKLCQCIGYVFGIKPEQLARMKYKELSALEVLWGQIEKVVSEYKTNDNGGEFEIRINNDEVKKYVIPEIVKTYFKGSNNLPDMNVQQIEQIGEAEDKLQEAIARIDAKDKTEEQIKGEALNRAKQKAQVTFNNTLKKIALCVNDPKDIPVDATFDMWVEKEMKVMTKISMQDAVDTLFFLTDLPKDYGILIGLNTMLSRSRSVAIPEKNQKTIQNVLTT